MDELSVTLNIQVPGDLEYESSYAELDVDLAGGGSIEVEPWTHHFAVGASYHLR